MPDILELNKAVCEHVFGARIVLDVYEYIGEGTIKACPRITVQVSRDDILHQKSLVLPPEDWANAEPEFIGRFFRKEFESILL